MPDVYVAGPYSHSSPHVLHERYVNLSTVAGVLLENRITVYSPITHGHAIIRDGGAKLPGDWEFWRDHDTEMMGHCRVFLACLFDGHAESVGLAAEREIAAEMGKPIVEYDSIMGLESLVERVKFALATTQRNC